MYELNKAYDGSRVCNLCYTDDVSANVLYCFRYDLSIGYIKEKTVGKQ